MLTALYCRGFVLPALSSQPCAHGLVPIVLGSGLVLIVLGSWSYSPGLILQILFSMSYSSSLILPALSLGLAFGIAPTWISCCLLALRGLTFSDIAGCDLAQVDPFSWIARLFCRRLGTYSDCDRARTLGFRGLLLWL